MKHLSNNEFDTSTYWESTVDESAKDQCPNFALDMIVGAVLGAIANRIAGYPSARYFFNKGSSKIAIGIICFQSLCAIVWVPLTVTSQAAYGMSDGIGIMLAKFVASTGLDIFVFGNVWPATQYFLATKAGTGVTS